MAAPLKTRRFTVDEYHRMADAGIFAEDDRVELLDGQIVPMTPIGRRHAACVNRLVALFAPMGSAVTLSVQNPVVLGEHHEPEPDFALLRYRADGYAAGLPVAADILLVVEVADTTVERDREQKIPWYARAGIPEAWLVDLAQDTVEAYRDPRPDGYREVRVLKRHDTLVPLTVSAVGISVADVLGPPIVA